MSVAPPPLVFDRMSHRFGPRVAVSGLDLTVRRGEMLGLIGPDGAGKTTTLRVALGLLSASGGRVTTCGLEPVRHRRALARRVGYLAQRFSLYGDLSVDENIAFFARVQGVAGWRDRREELLELVHMTPFRRRLARRLSGGMKQKLALAVTLIHTPELLVLDEPTTGVDPVSRRDFWRLLARLSADGLTLVMTTPYLDEAERCQRVALLHRGTLLALDDPEALRRGLTGCLVEVVGTPYRRLLEVLRQNRRVEAAEGFGQRVHARLAGGEAPDASLDALRRELAAAGIERVTVRRVPTSLEDVFIDRVRSVEQGEPGAEDARS